MDVLTKIKEYLDSNINDNKNWLHEFLNFKETQIISNEEIEFFIIHKRLRSKKYYKLFNNIIIKIRDYFHNSNNVNKDWIYELLVFPISLKKLEIFINNSFLRNKKYYLLPLDILIIIDKYLKSIENISNKNWLNDLLITNPEIDKEN